MKELKPKERFKIIFGMARAYRNNERAYCPATLPFVAWCGSKKANPNIFRCQLSFATKAKETAWIDLKVDPLEEPNRLKRILEDRYYSKITK